MLDIDSRFRTFSILTIVFVVVGCADDVGPLGGSFQVSPDRVDFDAVLIGHASTRAVIVENQTDDAIAVDVSAPEGSSIGVSPSLLNLPAREKRAAEITYLPTAVEPLETEVLFAERAGGEPSRIALPVSGRGIDPAACVLDVSPQVIEYGSVVVATTAVVNVAITNPCDREIRGTFEAFSNVGAISCDGSAAFCLGGIEYPIPGGLFTLAPGDALTIEAQFTPTIAGAREQGAFVVSSCDLPACEVDVRLDGNGVESGFRCTLAVDFGAVNPGACATQDVVCENFANVPVTFEGWRLASNGGVPSSDAFEVTSQSTVLRGGEQVTIPVSYCPTALGTDVGMLAIDTDHAEPRLATILVPLTGRGGGPSIEVSPGDKLDFGVVSTLAPVRRRILITNNGFDALEITDIVSDTDQTGAFAAPGASGVVLARGESMTIVVEFLPLVVGSVESGLLIRSNDPGTPEITICLRGEGVMLPPCSFRVTPPVLDFGDAAVVREHVRSFQIHNQGSSDCLLTAVDVAPGSDGAFELARPWAGSIRIPAGRAETIEVRYWPTTMGAHGGDIEFWISSQTSPLNIVRVSGRGGNGAMLVAPSHVDFGQIEEGCRTLEESIRIYNTTSMPMTVTTIRLTSAAPRLTLVSTPSLPVTVVPGGTLTFRVAYDPRATGSDISPIQIDATIAGVSLQQFVSVVGEVAVSAQQVDVVENMGLGLADVLLIVDKTSGTDDERAAMASNFDAFVRYADANAVDYRLGITTADLDDEQGRLVHADSAGEPFNGPISAKQITAATTPSPEAVFGLNLAGGLAGGGAVDESPLQAAYLALTTPNIVGHNAGFRRRNATLSVLVMADEAEQSVRSVDFYADFFQTLSLEPVTVSAIAGDVPGGCTGTIGAAAPAVRLDEIVRRTGGTFVSLCDPDWDQTMDRVGAATMGGSRRIALTRVPDVSSIEVEAGGVAVPSVGPGGTAYWSYDSISRTIVLTPVAPVSAGADVRVTYVVACP